MALNWKKRYLICAATGAVLVFAVEFIVHQFKGESHGEPKTSSKNEESSEHDAPGENEAEAKPSPEAKQSSIKALNQEFVRGLEAARPWGMLSSFDNRLRTSQYSFKNWSLIEPFNSTAKLNRESSESQRPHSDTSLSKDSRIAIVEKPGFVRDDVNEDITRRIDAATADQREAQLAKLEPTFYGRLADMWPNLNDEQLNEIYDEESSQDSKHFVKRTGAKILGWPDAYIYMFRNAFSGGAIALILNCLAILIVSPLVIVLLGGAIRGGHILGFFVVLALAPLLYSCVAAVLWVAMSVPSVLLSGILQMPAVDGLAAVTPALLAAMWHVPMMIAHKFVDESVEHRIARG